MSEPNDELGPEPDATTEVPRDALIERRRGGAAFPDEPFRAYEPLLDDDPVKVNTFWLDARLAVTPAGVAYAAHEDHSDEVMLLLLSEGAAGDAAARARFSGEINAMHIDTVVARGGDGQDEGRMGVRFRPEEDSPELENLPPAAPWAALAFDGSAVAVAEARRVLNAVDLETAAPISKPSGPGFQLPWIHQTGVGRTRVWPLAWPARRDQAGWFSIFTSWLLMLLIAALGLLLAILVFQNAPLVSPPAPIPSKASDGGSGSGSPQSGSPQSGDPSGPPKTDHTHEPTMGEPDEPESDGGGEPTVNRRL